MVFLDIFSKKKTIFENKKIIVDNRENNSFVPSELKKLGFELEFKQLDVADYLVRNIAIERKTISDFKKSIINKRIFNQLLEIKQYPSYFLIVEGISSEDIYSRQIHENAFRGMILSIISEFQVPIIFTKNEKDTAKYISVLAHKKAKNYEPIRPSKIILNDFERINFILEGFSGIGPVASKKLIEKFGSLKNIFDASLENLREVIGNKANEFHRSLNLRT